MEVGDVLIRWTEGQDVPKRYCPGSRGRGLYQSGYEYGGKGQIRSDFGARGARCKVGYIITY
jgi:hypothetical protein